MTKLPFFLTFQLSTINSMKSWREGLLGTFTFKFVKSSSPGGKKPGKVEENGGVVEQLMQLWLIPTPSAKILNFALMTWSDITECQNRSSATPISVFYPSMHQREFLILSVIFFVFPLDHPSWESCFSSRQFVFPPSPSFVLAASHFHVFGLIPQ